MPSEYKELVDFSISLARDVGQIQIDHFGRDHKIHYKADGSIQTLADRISSDTIFGRIKRKFSEFGILDEERKEDGSRFSNEYCFIVDPLDGSRSYADGKWNWGPKIAITKNGVPIVGVVYRPLFKEHEKADWKPELLVAEVGRGARRIYEGSEEILRVSNERHDFRTATSNRDSSQLESMLTMLGKGERRRRRRNRHDQRIFGKVNQAPGMKIVEIAKNTFDLVLYAPDMHVHLWDVAASQIILEEAGGIVTTVKGDLINYLDRETIIRGLLASNGQFDHSLFLDLLSN